MKNIMITATAESVEQAQALIDAGVDRIYVGEKDYGLRLPQTLSSVSYTHLDVYKRQD